MEISEIEPFSLEVLCKFGFFFPIPPFVEKSKNPQGMGCVYPPRQLCMEALKSQQPANAEPC